MTGGPGFIRSPLVAPLAAPGRRAGVLRHPAHRRLADRCHPPPVVAGDVAPGPLARAAGLGADEVDAVAYSFDPALAKPAEEMGLDDPWDHLRLTYAEQAPGFLAEGIPGLDPDKVRFVPHHVAHALDGAEVRHVHDDRTRRRELRAGRKALHRARRKRKPLPWEIAP